MLLSVARALTGWFLIGCVGRRGPIGWGRAGCWLPTPCVQVAIVLKKEIEKTQNKGFEKGGEYRQILVQVGL